MEFDNDLPILYADFGVDALILGVTVRDIFDNAYLEGFDGLIAGRQPIFRCASTAVASLAIGVTATINSTAYKVIGIEPDGVGETTLRLEVL